MIIGTILDFSLPLKSPVMVFALALIIILSVPFLLKRLQIPSIIGLITAGVIIGPNALHLLERNEAIDLFSTIGLLYIMFLAGLELDMKQFKRTRYKGIIFGMFTFIIPLTLGLPICYFVLDYTFTASLFIASMFSTHTLIAYPIISRLGISKEESVSVTVGGTILTDTLVLLILAVNIGLATGDSNYNYYFRLFLSLIIFLVIIFYIFPVISKWFFRNFENEKNAHFIYVLTIVFVSGTLAELGGIEPVIGAFMAGLAINRLIPDRSPLMNRVEFVGNSLFIPFFLISVGMLVDFRILLHGQKALVIAGVLTAVALTGKWFAALFTQMILKYSVLQRNIMFGLSSAHAVATLAVITVGYNLKILDDSILNGTIILIFITCLVASVIAEKSGKSILLEGLPKEKKKSVHEEKIMVPLSNPMTFKRLLELAMLIRDPDLSSEISALSVVMEHEDVQARLQAGRKLLEEAIEHGSSADFRINAYLKVDINVTGGIIRAAKETQTNILVVGASPKKDIVRKIVGNVLDKIIDNYRGILIVGSLIHPLNMTKKIIVFFPPYADKESGFKPLLDKIITLVLNLSKPVEVHCTLSGQKEIESVIRRFGKKISFSFTPVEAEDDFFKSVRVIKETDLLVFINSRKGMISYNQKWQDNQPLYTNLYERSNIIIAYLSGNEFLI